MRRNNSNNNRGQNNRRRGSGGGRSSNGGGNLAQQKRTALQKKENYLNQARDALSKGDRVEAEYYFQHVEHWSRTVGEILEKMPSRERDDEMQDHDDKASFDDDAGNKVGDDLDEGETMSESKPRRTARRAKPKDEVEEIPLPTSVLPETKAATAN